MLETKQEACTYKHRIGILAVLAFVQVTICLKNLHQRDEVIHLIQLFLLIVVQEVRHHYLQH